MNFKKNVFQFAISASLSLVLIQAFAQQAVKLDGAPDAKKTFTIEVEARRTPAKDQARTNSCWNVATSSFIESEVVRQGGPLVEISEVLGVRLAYPLKADAYVRAHGQAAFWEGGNNHDTLQMLKRFGAVPRAQYTGLLNGDTKLDHAEFDNASKAFLDAVIKSGRPSKAWRGALDGMLDAYFGKIPESFLWEGKLYTPKTFRDEVLKINPDDYVEITSFTHHPFYQSMRLEIPDNWANDNRFINVPIDDMERIMLNALRKGFSISWGGDTSEKGFRGREGYAVLDDEAKAVTQQDRQAAFDDWRSTDDHSMHIVGLSKDEKGNLFYLTKNSYGATSTPFEGHLHMSQNYVKMKTIYFMVHKDAIPADIRAKMAKSLP